MSNRFLFIKHGCRACLEYERAIYRINMFLPLDKKIIVRDNFEFEKFGIKSHITQERLSIDDFDGYPLLYFDGYIYKGGTLAQFCSTFVKTLLKEDLMIEF